MPGLRISVTSEGTESVKDAVLEMVKSGDENWGQTGDATARRGLPDPAEEIPSHQDGPGKRVFLGSCECFGKHSSSGDRIRTCDLEVMSLASYRAAPPRDMGNP